MPIPKCKIGFDCSLMMQCPGLSPEDCENQDNCGLIYEHSQEELAEIDRLRQIKESQRQAFICKNSSLVLALNETLRTNHQVQKAYYYFSHFEIYVLYLLSRNALVFAVDELEFAEILGLINNFNSDLSNLIAERNFIITSVSSELSSYNVKRPTGVYEYWQLSANKPIFKSVFSGDKGKGMRPNKKYDEFTKKIHLGKEGSLKHFLVVNFINNRNKMQKALTKLQNALKLIQEALDILNSIE